MNMYKDMIYDGTTWTDCSKNSIPEYNIEDMFKEIDRIFESRRKIKEFLKMQLITIRK